MRRNEVLGLRWDDIDFDRATIALNRGFVSVGYQLHETRGKIRNAPRPIDLDATTLSVLRAWRSWQHAEQRAVGIDGDGWVFTDGGGQPIHPHAISQAFERIARRACVPVVRLHDARHTHATLLIRSGVPANVVSERLGHATATFTIETYQHVMSGMQADAGTVAEALLKPASHALLPAATSTASARLKRRKKTD